MLLALFLTQVQCHSYCHKINKVTTTSPAEHQSTADNCRKKTNYSKYDKSTSHNNTATLKFLHQLVSSLTQNHRCNVTKLLKSLWLVQPNINRVQLTAAKKQTIANTTIPVVTIILQEYSQMKIIVITEWWHNSQITTKSNEELFLRRWTVWRVFSKRPTPRTSLRTDSDRTIHIVYSAYTCTGPCGEMIVVVRCTCRSDVWSSRLISMIMFMSNLWSHSSGIISDTFLCLSPAFWCLITWWSRTARAQLHDIVILSLITSSWQIQVDRSLIQNTVCSSATATNICQHCCLSAPW